MNDPDVIVSLTTWKPRLLNGHLEEVLSSILMQKTPLKIKIVLTIYKDDIKYINNKLNTFLKKNNVEVIEAEKNLRPHLKYFYTMQKYRNLPIITIDDDCVYENRLVNDLYVNYLKNPNVILAKRVHKITYDDFGKAKKYNEWIYECRDVTYPSFDLCATGVGGVLYPPDILKISDECIEDINKSLTTDDLYLRFRETNLGIKTKYISPINKKQSYIQFRESISNHALCQSINKTNNDETIKTLNFKRQIPSLTILMCINKTIQSEELAMRHLIDTQNKLSFLNPKIKLITATISVNDYSRFCIKEISDHFETDYVLILQMDSCIWNINNWTYDFFNFDYIGAPWKNNNPSLVKLKPNLDKCDDMLVGNGGFSLRSKKLCDYIKNNSDDYTRMNEDLYICAKKRNELEQHGFTFAPHYIAKKFAIECDVDRASFGIHKFIIDKRTNKKIDINKMIVQKFQ